MIGMPPKIVLFANTDWYLFNFRRSLAEVAQRAGYEVLLVSPDGNYAGRFASLGLRWDPLPMQRRSLNPLRELLVLWRLFRFFKRERPALVHSFTIKCVVYGSLAAKVAGVPARVSAVAGMGYVYSSRDVKARLLRPLVRAMLRFTLGGRRSRVIVQNVDDAAQLRTMGAVDSAKLRLIPGSGVDCARFMPHQGDRTESGPLRVLLASRLLWDKGIAEFVESARVLRKLHPRARFLLAGVPDAGNPAAVPYATLQGWLREGAVEWLGQVEDMATLFRSVDVVVLPSYREGLPKSLIEAAACALPLVTCDVPGCREVVSDGVDGLLVPPRDALALAQAIGRLLESSEMRVRLGQAARRKALERFDEQIVIASTLAVYDELLSCLTTGFTGTETRP
jgi:glycosyltransferase involved in cell wall biosynthesis